MSLSGLYFLYCSFRIYDDGNIELKEAYIDNLRIPFQRTYPHLVAA